jgi:hypothetical protein
MPCPPPLAECTRIRTGTYRRSSRRPRHRGPWAPVRRLLVWAALCPCDIHNDPTGGGDVRRDSRRRAVRHGRTARATGMSSHPIAPRHASGGGGCPPTTPGPPTTANTHLWQQLSHCRGHTRPPLAGGRRLTKPRCTCAKHRARGTVMLSLCWPPTLLMSPSLRQDIPTPTHRLLTFFRTGAARDLIIPRQRRAASAREAPTSRRRTAARRDKGGWWRCCSPGWTCPGSSRQLHGGGPTYFRDGKAVCIRFRCVYCLRAPMPAIKCRGSSPHPHTHPDPPCHAPYMGRTSHLSQRPATPRPPSRPELRPRMMRPDPVCPACPASAQEVASNHASWYRTSGGTRSTTTWTHCRPQQSTDIRHAMPPSTR